MSSRPRARTKRPAMPTSSRCLRCSKVIDRTSGIGLVQHPLDQGRGGLRPADGRQHEGQQDAPRRLIPAEDPHQRHDGVRVADGHQLRLGLAATVARPALDRLPQQADPPQPRALRHRDLLCGFALRLLLGRDPPTLVLHQPLRGRQVVARQPRPVHLDMPELLMRRLVVGIQRQGVLIMQLGEVGQPVLLAPVSQLVLRLRRLGGLLALDHVIVERTRLGDDVEDLALVEGQRATALQEQHLHAILGLRVRDDLPLDLATAPQLDDVRPGTRRRRPRPSRGAEHEPPDCHQPAVDRPSLPSGHDETLPSP